MELPVKKMIRLNDGLHEGVIVRTEYRKTPQSYEYLDVYIETKEIELKVGYPSFVTLNSRLGILLQNFGAILKEEGTVDPDKVLIGRKVTFMTLTEQTEKGSFSKILRETVRPA